MDEHDWLADRHEADRTHLRAVAYPDARLGERGGRLRRPERISELDLTGLGA
jgi:hypothetical protein